ncbi:MAG: thrombospondin type 3 repeat-containing protein [Patescibacteria group bacterium]
MTSILVILFLLVTPLFSAAQGEINAGFVSGLWYSRYPFFAGETVRLYAAIQNNSGFDIKGTVQFSNNDKLIGAQPFSAVNGRLVDAWVDWTPQKGVWRLGLTIVAAQKFEPGKDPEPITLTFSSFQKENVVVDGDADGDHMGDSQDTDDDNDSLSDREEKEHGTDSLVADTDGDGLSDKKEISGGTDPLKPPEKVKSNTAEVPGNTLEIVGNTLKEKTQAYAPRIAQSTQKLIEAIDARASNAARIIRAKKEHLEPSQYQSLFSVSLALLVPVAEHWRIAAGIATTFLLWYFIFKRSKKGGL